MSTTGVCRLCIRLLTFTVLTGSLLAQRKSSPEPGCFTIQVRLNGGIVNGPKTITLKGKGFETTLFSDTHCFKVPEALLQEHAIDIAFKLPRNRIYLSAIPAGFFAGAWDVYLEDKKFGKEVVVPKHARVKEACAVIFHNSEPERALLQTGCRKPVRNGRDSQDGT